MIVCCGYANHDLTVHLPVLPGAGDRVQASAMLHHDGGMGANAAVAAARMGGDVGFAGVVGEDPLSTAFLEALRTEGIDVSYTARNDQLTTAIVLVTEDGQRSIISQDDALTPARVTEVVRMLHGTGTWLSLDGYRFPSAARALAEGNGVRALVDLDGCTEASAASAALSVAEHVISGREEAERLLEREPSVLAVEHDCHILLTDGANGWRLYTPNGTSHQGPAIEVEVRDTTGAGDCFVGSYLAELDRGAAPENAAHWAAVAAGISCATDGARAGIPDRARVSAWLGDASL